MPIHLPSIYHPSTANPTNTNPTPIPARAEEFEIRYRVQFRKTQTSAAAKLAAEELREMQARCSVLRARLHGGSRGGAAKDSAEQPVAAGGGAQGASRLSRLLRSAILQIAARSANGIFSVGIYFADLISDVQVRVRLHAHHAPALDAHITRARRRAQVSMLLLTTGNVAWAGISIFLLLFQFLVVHLRVLPYLRSTFGSESWHYIGFLLFGFPAGLLGLDILMFFEPFGLLAILPFPEWVRQFVPACTRSRRLEPARRIRTWPHPSCIEPCGRVEQGGAIERGGRSAALCARLLYAGGCRLPSRGRTYASQHIPSSPFPGPPPSAFTRPARACLIVGADKATRIIAEVVIESLPQCLLQSYIYLIVVFHSRSGVATPSELAMLDFVSVIPTSILISSIAMLKMWIEVVNGARAAGLTIRAKAMQLWQVGAGLPLDALKKGTIVEWACPYQLEETEIAPLLDALGRNSSLRSLDMTKSGLTWSGPAATGAPLVENMSQHSAALSSLISLTISAASRVTIPVGRLRAGPEEAMAALRESPPFFMPGGAQREEIIFIGDLLRKNVQGVGPRGSDYNEEVARERTISIRTAAKGGKLRREVWATQVFTLLVEGALRRGHLLSLITAEALRDVGFTASELLSSGFVLAELRIGGFTADGLRLAGLRAIELREAGFSASELRIGGFSAKDLRTAGFSPLDLKIGGFSARNLKEIGLSAVELKANGFTAEELREGAFPPAVLKPLFTARQLRTAGFVAKELREVSFTLSELMDGGFTASDLRNAAYYCSEMREVGFKIGQLRAAGYSGSEMRIAGRPPTAMGRTAPIICCSPSPVACGWAHRARAARTLPARARRPG